ncbi:ABC transporter ATP-binding protein [Paenibacillus polymyxa]|uniref:ABC transporter ATP-binding protein n=1 Tax=Paenibacillus polymyxa TaxID=1406 RepID=UPI000589D0CF|nr:ABC transporter ATP-binding protein [Paenibacillus polymyxa]AJE51321.1 peptide ABC transporter ATPase [Paenibacillus polymyxa]QOH60266.1 ABC transporter ATP-binding protein [Paenibacillus polymyxa]
MNIKPVLEIKGLSVSFRIKDQYHPAVDHLDLTVNPNEVLAVVGESGCGKSALALSIPQLHDMERTRVEGKVLFKGTDLIRLSSGQMNKIRGAGIGMIFQDPLTALNPLMCIGKQIEENLDYHTSLSTKQKRERVLELLESVDIPNPVRVYEQYPHELSGGMRQRVMIAIAIACRPSLIIADEPTTALDVTIQSQILDLLKQLQQETGSGIILITHDLGVVAEVADRVVVMYAGEIVESADVFELFRHPQHPYTRSLLASMPGSHTKGEPLHVISGIVPSLQDIPRNSCRFASRIPWIQQSMHEDHPRLSEISPGHWVRCTCYQHFHFEDETKGEAAHGTTRAK